MYCECKEPKTTTSIAMNKTFKICSKSKGGCGCEIKQKVLTGATATISINGKKVGEFKDVEFQTYNRGSGKLDSEHAKSVANEINKRLNENPCSEINKKYVFPGEEVCAQCGGNGRISGTYLNGYTLVPCKNCKGKGFVKI